MVSITVCAFLAGALAGFLAGDAVGQTAQPRRRPAPVLRLVPR